MAKKYLIGVDIGVSFIKAGIYDFEGNNIATAVKNNPGDYPGPGIFIQSSSEMVNIVIAAIKESVEKSMLTSPDVEAIGFSGAMGGLMGIDEKWQPCAEWSIISDTRYYPYLSALKKEAGKEILEISGTNFPVFAPKMLWWKNDFPEIYARTVKFMGICGFIIGKLGNLKPCDAFMDRTISMFSGVTDLAKNTWSDKLCARFGIDKDRLPAIVKPDSIVAYLCSDAASKCGLKPGIPLVAGAGDKAAGNLGVGLVEKGMLVDEAATYGALSLCVDSFVPDRAFNTLENLPSPIEGLYTPGAYLVVSGATSGWFTKLMAESERQQAESSATSVFKILDEKSKDIAPGSEGLLAISLLGGRGYPSDPDIRGMWIGHSLMHRKEHFYKSMLESFAYEYAFYLKVMKNNYPGIDFSDVTVMGGGSRSDLYNQIKSDVLGLPYWRLNRDDFALLGDILMAGSAVGVFKDLKTAAKKFSKKTAKYVPDAKNNEIYKKYSGLYFSLFDKVREIFTDLKNVSNT